MTTEEFKQISAMLSKLEADIKNIFEIRNRELMDIYQKHCTKCENEVLGDEDGLCASCV